MRNGRLMSRDNQGHVGGIQILRSRGVERPFLSYVYFVFYNYIKVKSLLLGDHEDDKKNLTGQSEGKGGSPTKMPQDPAELSTYRLSQIVTLPVNMLCRTALGPTELCATGSSRTSLRTCVEGRRGVVCSKWRGLSVDKVATGATFPY